MFTDLETVLRPAIVAAIVTAIIGPLIFFFLKRWDEKKRRNFEIRFAEYKHYLRALEQIASSSSEDFERFMVHTYAECFNEILATGGESNEPLVRLNKEVNQLTARTRTSFSQATGELHGLRLVCSSKLLSMVDEFVNIQRALMDDLILLLGRLKNIDLNHPKSLVPDDMKSKGKKSQQLFDQIVLQMRKELGVN